MTKTFLIQSLTSPDVQSFIRQHESDDVSQLILRLTAGFQDIPIAVIAEQIIGRKKAKEKLPTYYTTNAIIYPQGINIEQCSSEQTALFKSTEAVASVEQRERCLDLTGGFGVDSYFFSKSFKEVHYVEPNKNLLEIARHNHQQLRSNGILYFNTTAEEYLKSTKYFFDLIYIDPSRRASGNRKVYSFGDCEPDVTSLQSIIFRTTKNLLIKAAPFLDLQQGLKSLTFVKQVFVIAVENECKEVLFYCEKNFVREPIINAINLSKGSSPAGFSFKVSEESRVTAPYSGPLSFLYEPNAAILKAGAFKLVTEKFDVKKLHPHTHLYTSDVFLTDFPGRVFRIIANVKPNPKAMDDNFPDGKANVTTRNYPLTVKQLREKTGLKDGGDNYLIGFSGIEKKHLVVAEKIS